MTSDPPAPTPTPPSAARRTRSARRLFSASVLILEAFVAFFAALVAFGLSRVEPGGPTPGSIALVAGVVVVSAVIAAGLLRTQAGYLLGWAIQVWLVMSGLIVPGMFVIGGVFAVLWIVGLRLGARIDRERSERQGAEAAG